MSKVITLRYAATCKMCGKSLPVGTRAVWGRGNGKGSVCYPSCKPTDTPAGKMPSANLHQQTYDFAQVREAYLSVIQNGADAILKRRNNVQVLDGLIRGWNKDRSFYGCTTEEMKTWLDSGYRVGGLDGVTPSLTPDRKRRRLRFQDEGELQLDLAMSGFDYPFLEWEKRERKPGMRVEVGITFNAYTSSEMLSAYQTWIARALYTLEEHGIDTEIVLKMRASDSMPRKPSVMHETFVRVKKENELTDFTSWSAAFSPGGKRHLGFLTQVMSIDQLGQDISSGLGSAAGGRAFQVRWDADTRTLHIVENSKETRTFPEAAMTEQLQEALRQAQGN